MARLRYSSFGTVIETVGKALQDFCSKGIYTSTQHTRHTASASNYAPTLEISMLWFVKKGEEVSYL
jgi:hypothetical protein